MSLPNGKNEKLRLKNTAQHFSFLDYVYTRLLSIN